MKIYALVGKSGTGKSYQAMNLCRGKNIAAIIDDGLFIVGSDILAGVSAKRQTTKVGAIKTALFTDEWHRISVREKIGDYAPDSILIIATSEGMAEKIAERLNLPDIESIIDIESITTENERETAIRQRRELGKHVIPVPTFKIKREFSGYFVDPLRVFRGRSKNGKKRFTEKSVVRPTYSYLGDYSISDRVISDIVDCVLKNMPTGITVARVLMENSKSGIRIKALVNLKYGVKIIETAKAFQEKVAYQVGIMTAFHVDGVDIEVRDLV